MNYIKRITQNKLQNNSRREYKCFYSVLNFNNKKLSWKKLALIDLLIELFSLPLHLQSRLQVSWRPAFRPIPQTLRRQGSLDS